ncbi:hypothetical protein EBZ80_12780 [bacterium]|nr:hypothetical protein [bacterium]
MTHAPVTWTTLNLAPAGKSKIGILLLDRPETANAFSGAMLEAIPGIISEAAKDPDLRCMVIAGRGKHFSAGADLAWMQESAKLSHQENLHDAAKLTTMFEAVANFPRPTVALVRGAAYGGAVGLIACCDIVIASDNSKFCLSEARLGLIPAVIMPYLARRFTPGALRRAAITSRVLDANEARIAGLVDVVAEGSQLDEAIRNELSLVVQAGPQAQCAVKALLDQVREKSGRQGDYTAQAIASARTGSEGQAGLKAFFAKSASPWVVTVPGDLKISHLLERVES